jgi:hypothetical protein
VPLTFPQNGNASIVQYDNNTGCDEIGTLHKISLASNNLQGDLAFTQGIFTNIRVYDIADNRVAGLVQYHRVYQMIFWKCLSYRTTFFRKSCTWWRFLFV